MAIKSALAQSRYGLPALNVLLFLGVTSCICIILGVPVGLVLEKIGAYGWIVALFVLATQPMYDSFLSVVREMNVTEHAVIATIQCGVMALILVGWLILNSLGFYSGLSYLSGSKKA